VLFGGFSPESLNELRREDLLGLMDPFAMAEDYFLASLPPTPALLEDPAAPPTLGS